MPTSELPALKNDLILKVIRGEPTERIPVWVMRQAGRYMKEFREMRSKYDFFTLCENPELASEVTLLPIKNFDVDAAIIFSDILVIPKALGMQIEMKTGVGPVFPHPLATPEDVDLLDVKNCLSKLTHVFEAITLTRSKLDGKVPLIGFAGAPWTLMSYMIEGGGSKTLSKAKSWLYKHPEKSEQLLKLLTNILIDYLVSQVLAGAQLLQIFESHAEYLGPELFRKFSLPYLKEISSQVKMKLSHLGQIVPMIVFAKGCHYGLGDLKDAGYDVIGLDWTIDPAEAREILGSSAILQGNMDPCGLYAPKEVITSAVHKMLDAFGSHNVICNLGHGIYPDVDPENMRAFVEAAHSYKP